jgi:hypothetical protein
VPAAASRSLTAAMHSGLPSIFLFTRMIVSLPSWYSAAISPSGISSLKNFINSLPFQCGSTTGASPRGNKFAGWIHCAMAATIPRPENLAGSPQNWPAEHKSQRAPKHAR